jgi:hypothetical protein
MPVRISSTAPRHIARRYLAGQCDTLARAIGNSTGFPLWAMKNKEEQIEHVFVRDPDSGLAVDIRGAMPLEEISKGSALEHSPHRFSEVEIDEVTATFGTPTPGDMRIAKRVLKDHLSRTLEKVQEVSPERSDEITP